MDGDRFWLAGVETLFEVTREHGASNSDSDFDDMKIAFADS
jgi:hypothetical protein